MNDLVELLGKRLDEVARAQLVVALGDKGLTELVGDRFHMDFKNSGIAFIAPLDGKVTSIQLFAEGYEGYRQYRGQLPDGLAFNASRSSVLAHLGSAPASGGGGIVQFLGKVPKWDRFDRNDYSLHVQYVDDETAINLISLMRPDSVPA